jgi:alpha/beta superfamily hydrolase
VSVRKVQEGCELKHVGVCLHVRLFDKGESTYMKKKTTIGSVGAVLAMIAVAVVSLVAHPSVSSAVENGPAPTLASVSGSGPFATTQTSVSRLSVSGFGGGVIYSPTASGTYGGIAISPGYTASWSSLSWLGPRLASHGFVVIGIETNSRFDQPSSRGEQLLAALDYLTESSSVRAKVDASRLAVAGHSMGGGGTLEAAADRSSLKAAIPLAPWNLDKSWSEVSVPTLIIGGESDSVAGVSTHSIPFYNSLGSPEKAYVELNGASHFFPQTTNSTVNRYMVSWLKRFVDGDTRYNEYICGSRPSELSDFRSTCPV